MSFVCDVPLGAALKFGDRGAELDVPGELPTLSRPIPGGRFRALREATRQAGASNDPDAVGELDANLIAAATAHLERFPPTDRPEAPTDVAIDEAAILRRHEQAETSGVSAFKRSERSAAKVRAQERAAAEIAEKRRRMDAAQAERQAALDVEWNALAENDSHRVLAHVEAAFQERVLPAAPCGLDGPELSLVLEVPLDRDVIPARMLTDSGAVYPRSEPEREALYLACILSQALAAHREAFAVASGLERTQMMILRREPHLSTVTCIGVTSFERAAFTGKRWFGPDPIAALAVRSEFRFSDGTQAPDAVPLVQLGLAEAFSEVAGQLDLDPDRRCLA